MTPLISVVIPAFNAMPYFAMTLDSVAAQTEMRWELIVVDDGSADETASLAESYACQDKRIRVIRQENAGQAAARNCGLQESSPDSQYIIFLDHDDVWEPDALAVLLLALEASPEAAASHGAGRYINSESLPVHPGELEAKVSQRRGIVDGVVSEWPRQQATSFAVLVVECSLVSPGLVLIRREILQQVGFLDTMPALGFSSLDDWDLWLRLSLRGDFVVADKVVLNYRLHEKNLSRQRRAMSLGEWYVRHKLIQMPELTPLQRRMACQQYDAFVFKTRREIATYLRHAASRDLHTAWNCLRQKKIFEGLAGLGQFLLRYRVYLSVRHCATPDGVWAYAQNPNNLLPENLC